MIHGWVARGGSVHSADCAEVHRALAEGSCEVWLDFEGDSEGPPHTLSSAGAVSAEVGVQALARG